MNSIGEKLRRARVELALTLEEISASHRISLSYLRAMEADDRAVFPAVFFYRSFVLQYAGALGLHDPEIHRSLETIVAAASPLPLPGQEPSAAVKGISPVSLGRPTRWTGPFKVLASMASLILVVAGCTGVYSWWESSRGGQSAPAKATARVVPPFEAQAKSAAPALPTVAPVPVSVPPGAAPKLSLSLAANETTWLSLSSDGKPIFSGMLEANQSKSLAAEGQARLVVGNAGAITVQWNGRPIPPLGKRGQVRVITFTPEGYQFRDSVSHTEHLPDSTR